MNIFILILLFISTGNMNLLVAAGPFFSKSFPHGQPLKSLIQKTIELQAKLLVLLGPIFESDFGMQLNNTSSENFQKCYDDILEAILNPLFRFVFILINLFLFNVLIHLILLK